MTQPRPKVTAIIAAYNTAQYLGAAIESVLGQTYRDFELHVVDDGSTDNTPEVVAQYQGDPRLRYTRQANAGQARATNFAIGEARGELLTFCDADDLWEPRKLEIQLKALEQDPQVGVVYARKRRITSDGAPLADTDDAPGQPHPTGKITDALFLGNFIPYGTAMVRKECFDAVGHFRPEYRFGLDWDLWLRVSTRYRFAFVDEVTYVYRTWPGQMTRNWRASYECAFKIMERFVDEHPDAVASEVVRNAYADSYTNRGYYRVAFAKEYGGGLSDGLRALRYRLGWTPAYRLIAKASVSTLTRK